MNKKQSFILTVILLLSCFSLCMFAAGVGDGSRSSDKGEWHDAQEAAPMSECSICCEERILLNMPCSNDDCSRKQRMCKECIIKSGKCPLCRSEYSLDKMAAIFSARELDTLRSGRDMRARQAVREREAADVAFAQQLQGGVPAHGHAGQVMVVPVGNVMDLLRLAYDLAQVRRDDARRAQEDDARRAQEADLQRVLAASVAQQHADAEEQEAADAIARVAQFEADEAMARELLGDAELARRLQQEEADAELARRLGRGHDRRNDDPYHGAGGGAR